MFKANGRYGSVKKNLIFLLKTDSNNNDVFDPKTHFPLKTNLRVKVFTALRIDWLAMSIIQVLARLVGDLY
jgi:hypothetical protein